MGGSQSTQKVTANTRGEHVNQQHHSTDTWKKMCIVMSSSLQCGVFVVLGGLTVLGFSSDYILSVRLTFYEF